MAVFFKNDCKFNGCGKTFTTLSSLIEHIEGVHIDFDPKLSAEFEEEHPSAVPLSYILKYSQCRQRREISSLDVRLRLLQRSSKSVLGYLLEEDVLSESDSSNDSWTPSKGISLSERKNGANSLPYKDKPFACSVPGCRKRYKNINGIKYHYKNGHKSCETPKRNGKHFGKKLREYNFKAASKKIFQDEIPSAQSDVTSNSIHTAFVKLASAVTDFDVSLPCNDNNVPGNTEDKLVITEQVNEETKMHIPAALYANNNNELGAADFTSAFINLYTPWPADSPGHANDVRVIRSSLQYNDVPNVVPSSCDTC